MSAGVEQRDIAIDTRKAVLTGTLALPFGTSALVVFAHGSGSSRLSARNIFVAKRLQSLGMGTLLFDLLTKEEDEDAEIRFDVDLLATRLIETLEWIRLERRIAEMNLGLFGASTGAAAAIYAAAHLPKVVDAIVSRGGRPDLAMDALCLIHCPTLFIVGGNDSVVLDLNREAFAGLPAQTTKELAVIPGATHLFEEPGALEKVADLAGGWYQKHLTDPADDGAPPSLKLL